MRRPIPRLLVFAALLLAALAVACGDDADAPDPAGETPTPTAPAPAATPTATPPPAATATPTATPIAAADLDWLDGLRCQGEWRNEEAGRSGAFAMSFVLGGQGGFINLEMGGPVFGGAGGAVDVPFRVEGDAVVIEADGGFLGQVQAALEAEDERLSLGELRLFGPPALGAEGRVIATEFELTPAAFALAADVEPAEGPASRSLVEADCATLPA